MKGLKRLTVIVPISFLVVVYSVATLTLWLLAGKKAANKAEPIGDIIAGCFEWADK